MQALARAADNMAQVALPRTHVLPAPICVQDTGQMQTMLIYALKVRTHGGRRVLLGFS